MEFDMSNNLKTEWGGAKIPDLVVSNPKGRAKERIRLNTKEPQVEKEVSDVQEGGGEKYWKGNYR